MCTYITNGETILLCEVPRFLESFLVNPQKRYWGEGMLFFFSFFLPETVAACSSQCVRLLMLYHHFHHSRNFVF